MLVHADDHAPSNGRWFHQKPELLLLTKAYVVEPEVVAAIPDEQIANGMLDVDHVLPSNSWSAIVLSPRRPKTESLPGAVATTPPALGSTAAVTNGGGGGVHPCAGACSAVELSTASAVVHANSATVYGGEQVTSRHAIGPRAPISWWHCP